MRIIIDRMENNTAVAELPNGKMLKIPRELFENAGEGDVVDITVNKEETQKRKTEIRKLMDDVWED